jgi:hypothetical protein
MMYDDKAESQADYLAKWEWLLSDYREQAARNPWLAPMIGVVSQILHSKYSVMLYPTPCAHVMFQVSKHPQQADDHQPVICFHVLMKCPWHCNLIDRRTGLNQGSDFDGSTGYAVFCELAEQLLQLPA